MPFSCGASEVLPDAAIDPTHPTGQRVRLDQVGGTNKFINLWSNIGAAQGWLVIRKRNRSNDMDRICGCFEGRCSIQLSYGRSVNYCNPTIELAAQDSDLSESRFPRCAQFFAYLTATWLQTWHPRTDEHSEAKFQSGNDRRSSPASRHRSRIHPNESRTCGVRKRAQRGAQAWNCFLRPRPHISISLGLGNWKEPAG